MTRIAPKISGYLRPQKRIGLGTITRFLTALGNRERLKDKLEDTAHIAVDERYEFIPDNLQFDRDVPVAKIWFSAFLKGDLTAECWQLSSKALDLHIDDFCRVFYKSKNFELVLAAWVRTNVEHSEDSSSVYKTIADYWFPRAFFKNIDIGGGKEGTSQFPTRSYTKILEDIALGAKDLFWGALKGIWKRRRGILLAGTLTMGGLTAYQIYKHYRNYQVDETAAMMEQYREKMEDYKTNKLFHILSTSKKSLEIIVATKILAKRAEEHREESSRLRADRNRFGPSKWKEDDLLERPVFLHRTSYFIQNMIKDLDPKSREAAKNIRWVLITPNVRSGIKQNKSYEVYGTSLGDGVIVVVSKEPDGRLRSNPSMLGTLAHEMDHEIEGRQSLPTLKKETSAFKAGLRTLKQYRRNNRRKMSPGEARELNDAIAITRARVRMGEYLEKFGDDFLNVYPENHILAKTLLEAEIPREILESDKYSTIKTDSPELDRKLQLAIRVALIVKTHEDNPKVALLMLKELRDNGSSQLEKYNAQSAIEHITGQRISPISRRAVTSRTLPPFPIGGHRDVKSYYALDKESRKKKINQAIESLYNNGEKSERFLMDLSHDARLPLIEYISKKFNEKKRNEKGFQKLLWLLVNIIEKDRTSEGAPYLFSILRSWENLAETDYLKYVVSILYTISQPNSELSQFASRWISILNKEIENAKTGSTNGNAIQAIGNLSYLARLPLAKSAKQEILKAAIQFAKLTDNNLALNFCMLIINDIKPGEDPNIWKLAQRILLTKKLSSVHKDAVFGLALSAERSLKGVKETLKVVKVATTVKTDPKTGEKEVESLYHRHLLVLRAIHKLLTLEYPAGERVKAHRELKKHLKNIFEDKEANQDIRRKCLQDWLTVADPEEVQDFYDRLLSPTPQNPLDIDNLTDSIFAVNALNALESKKVRRQIRQKAEDYLKRIIEAGMSNYPSPPGKPLYADAFSSAIWTFSEYGGKSFYNTMEKVFRNESLPLDDRVTAATQYIRRASKKSRWKAIETVQKMIVDNPTTYVEIINSGVALATLRNVFGYLNSVERSFIRQFCKKWIKHIEETIFLKDEIKDKIIKKSLVVVYNTARAIIGEIDPSKAGFVTLPRSREGFYKSLKRYSGKKGRKGRNKRINSRKNPSKVQNKKPRR